MFQAKAWRSSSEANKAKYDQSQLEVGSLKASLTRREKELLDAQAELVELRKDKDRIIDEYFESPEYQDIITQHDDLLFPVQYTKGWDEALAEVSRRMPGSLTISDFPSPHAPNQLERALAGEDVTKEDDRVPHSEPASQPGEESEESSSGEEESGEEGEAEESGEDSGSEEGDA